jgi:hypothetical protein
LGVKLEITNGDFAGHGTTPLYHLPGTEVQRKQHSLTGVDFTQVNNPLYYNFTVPVLIDEVRFEVQDDAARQPNSFALQYSYNSNGYKGDWHTMVSEAYDPYLEIPAVGNTNFGEMPLQVAPYTQIALKNRKDYYQTLDYTPSAGFVGTDTLTYKLDASPLGTEATVTITVTGSAVDDTVTTVLDTPIAINVLANDSPGAAAPINIVTGVTHGSTSITGGIVTYTPTTGYIGADAFTYTAAGVAGTATVSITVTSGVVARVIATPIALQTPNSLSVSYPLVLVSGPAFQSDDTMVITSPPANGSVTYNASTNTITYTPVGGYVGIDPFEFKIVDN